MSERWRMRHANSVLWHHDTTIIHEEQGYLPTTWMAQETAMVVVFGSRSVGVHGLSRLSVYGAEFLRPTKPTACAALERAAWHGQPRPLTDGLIDVLSGSDQASEVRGEN